MSRVGITVIQAMVGAQFTYKKKKYEIIGYCRFKHPETRKWIEAVTYQFVKVSGKLSTNRVFVREFNEFFERFDKNAVQPNKPSSE